MRDWDTWIQCRAPIPQEMPEWDLGPLQTLLFQQDWNWVPADYPQLYPDPAVCRIPPQPTPADTSPGSGQLVPFKWFSSGNASSRRKRKARADVPTLPSNVFISPLTVSPSPHTTGAIQHTPPPGPPAGRPMNLKASSCRGFGFGSMLEDNSQATFGSIRFFM